MAASLSIGEGFRPGTELNWRVSMANIEIGAIEGYAVDARRPDGTLIAHYEEGDTIRLDATSNVTIAPCTCERKS